MKKGITKKHLLITVDISILKYLDNHYINKSKLINQLLQTFIHKNNMEKI